MSSISSYIEHGRSTHGTYQVLCRNCVMRGFRMQVDKKECSYCCATGIDVIPWSEIGVTFYDPKRNELIGFKNE